MPLYKEQYNRNNNNNNNNKFLLFPYIPFRHTPRKQKMPHPTHIIGQPANGTANNNEVDKIPINHSNNHPTQH
jgi:hypothetical protein